MKPAELAAHLGQEVACSGWVEVTQARIDAFAHATGDHQFIHTDPVRAAAGPFGGTVAHGFLTLSLLAGEFMTQGGVPTIEGARLVVNYGLNRVRFITPVRAGARLRARAVLQAAQEGEGHVQLTLGNTIEIEGEARPACTAEVVYRIFL
ncbi:MaoC family dehydratase [Deinococcus multiflagellatus]|uniref:MaoC family dehydratase n=1 Tax=Deinococcus multiflagellatus TaxID=1656887 RepID=A0ABW1ZST3_9DEIO|nr:MaoC family dehydratase [Deinococcus multiflagellatus]MBZ9713616.1 MaoC family dehydratase [Deinococcus multiflagellatus]